eukprot:7327442-Alexandrium_andersonii.AAC.1
MPHPVGVCWDAQRDSGFRISVVGWRFRRGARLGEWQGRGSPRRSTAPPLHMPPRALFPPWT